MWGSGAMRPWRPTAVPSAEKYGGCKDMTALWGPDYAGQDVMRASALCRRARCAVRTCGSTARRRRYRYLQATAK